MAGSTRGSITLPNVRFVLCRPSESRNIGAACRAIKNFGISRLTVVSADDFDDETARRLAVGAADVLESAQRPDRLEDALRGSELVAGVTRRVGQKRKRAPFTPWQLADRVGRQEVAVVFGNEQSGLSDEELELCHLAVMIPTSPEFPSLNLSHAVQVVAYELYKSALFRANRTYRRAVDYDTLENHVASIVASLNEIGFHTQSGPQGMQTFLREILGRASLSAVEARRIEGMFSKLRGMYRSDSTSG